MNLVVNTDLFIVGLAITGIAILGFLIYFNNLLTIQLVTEDPR